MTEKIHVLDVPMEGQFEGETIRDYLRELFLTLWDEGEGFSGKRPFGNSGWEYDLYIPLVRHGFIKGTIDKEYDDVSVGDKKEAHNFVRKIIEGVFV